jgi:2-keto-3-deoxy-L-rhamnonate aldolase RhmA
VLRWARFHPAGERGVNGTGVDGRYAGLASHDYFRQANEETIVGLQIEHADAVAEVEAIAALPGLDFLFVGPADLSQSLGLPGEWNHPRMWTALERVARAAADHKVPWAVLPCDPAYARRCVDMGCRMLSLGIDVFFFQRGVSAYLEEYGEFFG